MKIIKCGAENATKVIYIKQIPQNKKYRILQYTYLYSENGRYLIQNNLTKEVAELNANEWAAINLLRKHEYEYTFLEQNGLIELAQRRYIVETECDETALYQKTVYLLKMISGQKNGLGSYIIFPTTGCNARCIYCYEDGYAVKTMTPEIADCLVDFICKTHHNDTIKLKWFGGEPLVGAKIIRHICTALQGHGIPYKSSMITNASLMTKELAQEAKELWHLYKVQVSLDGARQDYMQRKNYYTPDKHNYDTVMQAIHFLADEEIKVQLRVNVDFDNIKRIPGFLREIKEEFGEMEHISLYLAPLYQVTHSERCIELYRQIFALEEMIDEMGIKHSSYGAGKPKFKLNSCMADSMDKSIVITPDGAFNNCEHLPEHRSWGNIFDGVTDQNLFETLCKPTEIDEQCRKCPFLPFCTPYYKKGCYGWFKYCYEYYCLAIEHSLHNLLAGSHNKVIDNTEKR